MIESHHEYAGQPYFVLLGTPLYRGSRVDLGLDCPHKTMRTWLDNTRSVPLPGDTIGVRGIIEDVNALVLTVRYNYDYVERVLPDPTEYNQTPTYIVTGGSVAYVPATGWRRADGWSILGGRWYVRHWINH